MAGEATTRTPEQIAPTAEISPAPQRRKLAVITGTSSGLGQTTAEVFMQGGWNVVGNSQDPRKMRRHDGLIKKAEEYGASYTPIIADIAKSEDRLKLRWDAIGYNPPPGEGIDALILNAAGGAERDSTFQDAMRINFEAQIELVKQFLPYMNKGAKIIFITSTLADQDGTAKELYLYRNVAVSKQRAQEALTGMIPELEERGVTFGTVVSGLIDGTNIYKLSQRLFHDEVEKMTSSSGGQPIPRETVAEVIKNAAESSFKSGEKFRVGGQDLEQIDPGIYGKTFTEDEVASILSPYNDETRKVDRVKILNRDEAIGYYTMKDGIDSQHLTGDMAEMTLHAGHWWDEGAGQAAGVLLSQVLIGRPVAVFSAKDRIRYRKMVFPGQVLEYHVRRIEAGIEGITFECTFMVNGEVVGEIGSATLPILPSREFALKEYSRQKDEAEKTRRKAEGTKRQETSSDENPSLS